MKKLFIVSLLLLSKACVLHAEQTKYVYNAITGRLDLITALSTTSIAAGIGITVSTTSSGVSISAGGVSISTNYIHNIDPDVAAIQEASFYARRGVLEEDTDAFNNTLIVKGPYGLSGVNLAPLAIELTDVANNSNRIRLPFRAYEGSFPSYEYGELGVTSLDSSSGQFSSLALSLRRGGLVDMLDLNGLTNRTTLDSNFYVSGGTSTFAFTAGFEKGLITSTQTIKNLSPGVLHLLATSSNVTTSLVSLSTEVTGVLAQANGGTNNSTTYSIGSIVFGDGLKLTQDNSNLYFSTLTKTMGLGTNSLTSAAAFTVRQSTIQASVTFASAVENIGVGASNYNAGDTLIYRIYAYRTIGGVKIYSPGYYETPLITIANNGNTVSLDWGESSGATGYLIVRNLNGIGYDDRYVDVGDTLSVVDDYDFDTLVWTFATPPISTIYFQTLYNYIAGSIGYSVFGGSGYFDGVTGVGVIPTSTYGLSVGNVSSSTVPFFVNQTNSSSATGAIFRGYSDGGFVNKSVVQVQNSNAQKVIDFSSENLYPYDGGDLNLIGYATVASDQYAFGTVTFVNNSSEASGDKRVGQLAVIRNGAWNTSTVQILTREASSGFQYALVMTNGKTGISGISIPLARLHLGGGSLSIPAMRFTSAALTTSNRTAGDFQFLTNKWYGTGTTGTVTREFTMNDSVLTSGRMVFVSTNGALLDSAQITYSTSTATISVASFTASGLMSGTTAQFNSSMTVTGAMKVGGLVNFSSSAVVIGGVVAGSLTSNGATSLVGAVTSNASIKQVAGTGTLSANVGGTLFAYYASSGNAAGIDSDLYRSSVTANTLANAGDSLYIIAGGTFATSVSTDKRIKVKFNATTVFDSGALSITTSATWNLTCSLVRVSASSQRSSCNFETSSTSFPGTASFIESSENLAIGNILKITGGGTNANDSTAATHRINFEPAP